MRGVERCKFGWDSLLPLWSSSPSAVTDDDGIPVDGFLDFGEFCCDVVQFYVDLFELSSHKYQFRLIATGDKSENNACQGAKNTKERGKVGAEIHQRICEVAFFESFCQGSSNCRTIFKGCLIVVCDFKATVGAMCIG